MLKAAGVGVVGIAGGFLLGRASKDGPRSWPSMTLKPGGLRAGADSGNPMIAVHGFKAGNTKGAGIWECLPGGFPVVNRPSTETCYIISGRATITNQDGSKTELGPGTWHTLPTGWTGRWDITEKLRKMYVITP
mmetsp:Transcript_133025/g.296690  ORF Transcript_133025/g.296690 Transcript_133025/m.296690 type:complete len:134 (-) Transcript_133025:63-464(-)